MLTIGSLAFRPPFPKLCVPITATSREDLQSQCHALQHRKYDLIEFRYDYFGAAMSATHVHTVLATLRRELPHVPLLFTLRTEKEGGKYALPEIEYAQITQAALADAAVDAIDLEYTLSPERRTPLCRQAQARNLPVVLSFHNFRETPSHASVQQQLEAMYACRPAITKVAYMPQTPQDVLTVFQCSLQFTRRHPQAPLIALSMGNLGRITRIGGAVFGSIMTFADGVRPSAPGQLPADLLYTLRDYL